MQELLLQVTEIIQETGFESIESFPKLYIPETKEDKDLDEMLQNFIQNSTKENWNKLFLKLSAYIECDDINLGLMAKAAEELGRNNGK